MLETRGDLGIRCCDMDRCRVRAIAVIELSIFPGCIPHHMRLCRGRYRTRMALRGAARQCDTRKVASSVSDSSLQRVKEKSRWDQSERDLPRVPRLAAGMEALSH